MDDSSIAILIFLFVLFSSLILVIIGFITVIKWLAGLAGGTKSTPGSPNLPKKQPSHACRNCGRGLVVQMKFCGACGAQRLTLKQEEQLGELEITLRQLELLNRTGPPDGVNFRVIRSRIENERERMLFPRGKPGVARQHSLFEPEATKVRPPAAAHGKESPGPPFITPVDFANSQPAAVPNFAEWSKESDRPAPVPSIPKTPRKPFTDVLAAFMEESNIRWGEVIGGLLIIGCSTALVISLWAQISRVPVLKFFIFTTVTAALFGVGFYTEHHWKLPTTSRGILTIATLLVPLNFLAIAAVSTNTTPGVLVIGSEIVAPAIFLCLLYFGGRSITSRWPHLLAAGALGSSVGQLLVRHFADPTISPIALVALGAVPLIFYVGASSWALKIALADGQIDELEAVEILTTLGALTFAVALPFGLLLYKGPAVDYSKMHLAPLFTLGGMPMLAAGMLLWRRIADKQLAGLRTGGASIAIFGMVIAVTGMLLAWPNPASVVPAALFNFLIFTTVGITLDESRAHVLAASCLAFGYVIAFHVFAGHVPWQNLRIFSLVEVTTTVSTGQFLLFPFLAFVLVYEWLSARRPSHAVSYLIAACGVAAASLLFLLEFGIGPAGDPFHVSAIVTVYAAGLFWFAWRTRRAVLSWGGTVLIFCAASQVSHSLLAFQFPWQAALLLFAFACVIGALAAQRFAPIECRRIFVLPLQYGAIAGASAGALFLVMQLAWFGCEPPLVFAGRAFIVAAVALGLLVLKPHSIYFTAFQVAIASTAALLTKFALQHFDWYAFRPAAWLHPWALQTQGIVLGLTCLGWLLMRMVVRRQVNATVPGEIWYARILLVRRPAFDQPLAGALVLAFVMLMVLGAANGVSYELTNPDRIPLEFNLAGHPHALLFGVGSLFLLAVLLATMVGNLLDHGHQAFAVGVVLVLWAVCPLVAGRFEPQLATASAGRWTLALFLISASVASGLRRRGARRSREARAPRPSIFAQSAGRTALLLITVPPLVLLTISPVIDAINRIPARGPRNGLFVVMGAAVLYGGPLVLSAAAFAVHAATERSPAFAFAFGLMVNFAVTVVHVMSVASVNQPFNRAALVTALQLNAIAAAGVALMCMATRRWWINTGPAGPSEVALLTYQKFFALALNAVVIVPLVVRLIGRPSHAGIATIVGGSFNGWLAALLALAATVAFVKLHTGKIRFVVVGNSLVAFACLAAFRADSVDTSNWAGLHVLLAGLVVTPWLLMIARMAPGNKAAGRILAATGLTFDDDWAWDAELFTAVIAGLAVLVALRGPFSDPLGAGWSISALLAMSALAVLLNSATFRRRYMFAAGLLVNVAVSIWIIKYQTRQVHSLAAFVEVNVIAVSLVGLLGLFLDLRNRRCAAHEQPGHFTAFHDFAALGSLVAMAAVVAAHLHDHLMEFYQTFIPRLDGLALTAMVFLLFACLWDRKAKYAVAGLYVSSLLISTTILHQLNLQPRHLVWWCVIAAAIQTVAASLLWRTRAHLAVVTNRLRIPSRIEAKELPWLTAANAVLVAGIIVTTFFIELSYSEFALRSLAATAVALQAAAFVLLADGTRPLIFRRAAVGTFAAGLVYLSWSFLTPGLSGTWLNRAVLLMTLMFAAVGLCALGLQKLDAQCAHWHQAIRDCVPVMTLAGILAFAFVLGAEIYYQIEFGAVRVSLAARIAVGLTILGSIVACVLFALSPKHDPLGLSGKWRGSYVYVAETMMVLLFMHIRLTMPWLFTGFFQRYWPLVVLAIAYAGVAVAEFFKRRDIPVLARPIERTGAFLPMLPVTGFWVAQSQVEYSTLLFVVGGLYGLLSILRKSFWFGVAAAMAGNGGLWYVLQETSEYQFSQYPQLWLIPAAISVLAAAHLNRKDFSEAQMTAIRYGCLMTIYVSSTADIFINGVANSPWLPLVLAALAIAGVFTGMIFRVKAFLLLGSTFLLLAVITMIKYASVNFGWTWLWYVAGIFTGAIIITTFAVFEKRRTDVLRMVEGFKDWKG